MQVGEVVGLERLGSLLDVDIEAWDRVLDALVREFRNRRATLGIEPGAGLAGSSLPGVDWSRLFDAQVRRGPRLDREAEFRMARCYEFCKARVTDAMVAAGHRRDLVAGLLHRSFRDLPVPAKRKRQGDLDYLRRCIEDLETVRNQFVERSLYIVPPVMSRYRFYGVDEADLIQEGNASLFQAIDGFDWRREVRFRTYAQYWVHQAALKTLYNSARTVRIPIWVQKAYRRIQKLRDECRRRTGEDLSIAGIADKLEMPGRRVEQILGAWHTAVSLDERRRATDADGVSLAETLSDEAALPVPVLAEPDRLHDRLTEAMAELPSRDAAILSRRYGLDGREPETLAEIGADMGVTAERVRQIQQRALSRLQEPLEPERLRRA